MQIGSSTTNCPCVTNWQAALAVGQDHATISSLRGNDIDLAQRWRGVKLLAPTGYAAEAELHTLVEQAPHILPLAGSPRLIVVGREVRIGTGFTDLLAVEPNGRLAIIEIKVASNPEARRAVDAQVLGYAAYLAGSDPQEVEQQLLGGRLQKRGYGAWVVAWSGQAIPCGRPGHHGGNMDHTHHRRHLVRPRSIAPRQSLPHHSSPDHMPPPRPSSGWAAQRPRLVWQRAPAVAAWPARLANCAELVTLSYRRAWSAPGTELPASGTRQGPASGPWTTSPVRGRPRVALSVVAMPSAATPIARQRGTIHPEFDGHHATGCPV
jgi:hypothetical protein